jgi:LPXTG-site transpeptidase (sortase) family protein
MSLKKKFLIFVNLICVVILLYPLYLDFTFNVGIRVKEKDSKASDTIQGLVNDSKNSPAKEVGTSSNPTKMLIIPSIDLSEEVYEGISDITLNKGVWIKPNGALPSDLNGNVILSGHRFGYMSDAQRVFFHLDKVKVGDYVVVIWDGTDYTYRVEEVIEVLPEDIWVEDQSIGKRLTLYTCTPLWTSERRLVVRAIFVE